MPGNGQDAINRVKVLFDTSLTDDQIDRMLDFAEDMLVSYVDPSANPKVTPSLRSDLADWIAAHFCAVIDRGDAQIAVGGVRLVKEGKTGMGLRFTQYGQQAIILDPTNNLSRAGRMQTRELKWVASDQYAELD